MHKLETLFLTTNDAFAIYRLPSKSDIIIIKQNENLEYNFDTTSMNSKGFVFYPFDKSKNSALFIQADKIFKNQPFSFNTNSISKQTCISKESYLSQAEKFITKIKNGFEKIILSRTKSITNNNIDIFSLFKNLENKYKTAMVFLVNHPKVGTWMGATPEKLLELNEAKGKSIALAGTQFTNNINDIIWESKEIKEQKAVMNYIEEIFQNNGIQYKAKGPFTKQVASNNSGTLVHLATTYEFTNTIDPIDLIEQLHPTPAVSGFPKQKAIDFINKNEGYNREYYTGFLGPINIENNKSIKLYVNLRSMKIYKNNFLLFLGGGLNSQSIAESEWQETENKAKTLEEVIEMS